MLVRIEHIVEKRISAEKTVLVNQLFIANFVKIVMSIAAILFRKSALPDLDLHMCVTDAKASVNVL